MKNTCIIAYLLCFASIMMVSCQKDDVKPLATAVQISMVNPGFEDLLNGWTIETAYIGGAGYSSTYNARRTDAHGLNFYAAQSTHYPGAPQETPWNGKIYQTITGLKDGNYTFKVYADAVGTGMYLWAGSNEVEVKSKIKSS